MFAFAFVMVLALLKELVPDRKRSMLLPHLVSLHKVTVKLVVDEM